MISCTQQKIFLFDVDGTLTLVETLPYLAGIFNCAPEMYALTCQAIRGEVPFEDSFKSRISLFSHLAASQISAALQKVSLYPLLTSFIHANHHSCALVTSNLDCWVRALLSTFNCARYTSKAVVSAGYTTGIADVLDKAKVVASYQDRGCKVVMIGDGCNDIPAMQRADIAIACGLTHTPAPQVIAAATYTVFEEKELYALLCKLAKE